MIRFLTRLAAFLLGAWLSNRLFGRRAYERGFQIGMRWANAGSAPDMQPEPVPCLDLSPQFSIPCELTPGHPGYHEGRAWRWGTGTVEGPRR